MTPELQKELIEFLHKVEHRFLKPKAEELIEKINQLNN
jgi:thermostable 8-oxoguanine DNA glycosylase